MTSRGRGLAFVVVAAGLAALLVWGIRGLPRFGHPVGAYGPLINAEAVPELHVTDAVTAVNFDYRAFDTLGEEFILFASVIGVALILRRLADESEHETPDEASSRSVPAPSDAVRVVAFGLTGPVVLFGIYVVVHGQLTPGGGFQGGVILATAPLVLYLAGGLHVFRRITSPAMVEAAEATGAGGYALLGLGTLLAGAACLHNILPLGTTGTVTSGGTIPLVSLTTGLEVTAGFTLLLGVFLEQALAVRERGRRR